KAFWIKRILKLGVFRSSISITTRSAWRNKSLFFLLEFCCKKACSRAQLSQMDRMDTTGKLKARKKMSKLLTLKHIDDAPVAQLDRASGYEPEGREFESPRAHHFLLHFHLVTSLHF